MQKTLIVTLSNSKYYESRKILEKSAKSFGYKIDSINFEDLRDDIFFIENKNIIFQEKGLGFWLWKPYIIFNALKKVKENDVVVYIDAGVQIIQNLSPIIQICKDIEPILLFENATLKNSSWTKRDSFILMDLDNPHAYSSLQCDASICLFRKCEKSLSFVEEWLRYCTNENILTDKPNEFGDNLPDFIDHRMDQSVLSLLAFKYNIHLYRVPSQFGNHYKQKKYRKKNEFNCISQWNQNQVNFYSHKIDGKSNYGQLLNHHRGKIQIKQKKTFINKIIHFTKYFLNAKPSKKYN